MDNFNVLVIMQKEKETGELLDTVLSVQLESGIELVKKAYVTEEKNGIYLVLHLTTPDVEDWDFYGIYDNYDPEVFEAIGADYDEEEDFNPSWIIKVAFRKTDSENQELVRSIVKVHENELKKARIASNSKKEHYIKVSKEEN